VPHTESSPLAVVVLLTPSVTLAIQTAGCTKPAQLRECSLTIMTCCFGVHGACHVAAFAWDRATRILLTWMQHRQQGTHFLLLTPTALSKAWHVLTLDGCCLSAAAAGLQLGASVAL
jgi:hypothetical protein